MRRRGLVVCILTLSLGLAACGHGRVSADDETRAAEAPVSQPAPEPAQGPTTSTQEWLVRADLSEQSASPRIVGALSADEINQTIYARRVDLRGCYVAPRIETPTLAGKVTVQLTISSTGRVSEAVLSKSSLNHAGLEDCMRRMFLMWIFPEPADGGTALVIYSFSFDPRPVAREKDAWSGPLHVIRPVLRPTNAKGERALDPDEIRIVIRQRRDEVRACYDAELQKNPNPTLAGQIIVKFTIAIEGAVSEAEVKESTLNHEGVERCLLGVIRSLQFPPLRTSGSDVMMVTYPFNFSSGG